MEKSFDLGSLLRKHQKKHKSRPTQFESVAGGVLRRIENCLKQRKSSRLSQYDFNRYLPQPSPVPVSEAKQKADSRRLQLQKWKEEKERLKKELASKKIKPFITGVAHNPLKYVPPPPAKAVPSSSGRVTRSQSARNHKTETKKVQPQSFAPKNAGFRAPKIKTLTKMPQLEPLKNKKDIPKLNFEPVVRAKSAITTRSQAYQKIAMESRARSSKFSDIKLKSQVPKPLPKPQLKSKVLQTSSSSENESLKQTSTSSSDVDLTARIISSSESNVFSSTDSSKSLQSSSSCEFVPDTKSPISKRKSLRISITKSVTPQKSPQQSNVRTPRNPVPRSESSSEERLRSPKSPVNVPMTPEQISEEFKKISPCVTMSRGKENARKEMKKKMEEGLLDEDASDMDSIEHFKRQLASEIKRMTEICEVWDKINEQISLPESVQGLVLGAVGQARLLISQKMQQFAQLVQRCARPEPGSTLVTPADLRGFWDMLFIQVENLDMRFKELEELKARNWVEEVVVVPAARKPRAARPAGAVGAARAAGATRAAAPSRLRDMIAAARKAKAQEAASQAAEQTQPEQALPEQAQPEGEERTFEAGFFRVSSPARSPRPPRSPATPRDRRSLLKAVLSNEAEKASASKKSASFAMLRASVLGKNVECEGVAPLPPSPLPQINLHATPGRSILKQPQDQTNKSTTKQTKIVLFNSIDSELNSSVNDLNLSKEQVNCESTAAKNIDPEEQDGNTITDLSHTDIKEEVVIHNEKENSRKSSKLIRQDAFSADTPPVMTRRMQRYAQKEQMEDKNPLSDQKVPHSNKKTPKRSRKKVQAEEETEQESQQTDLNTPRSIKQTPRRSLRNKVATDVEDKTLNQEEEIPRTSEKKTPKRSTRKKVLTEIESNVQDNYTPMRSTRRRKTDVIE